MRILYLHNTNIEFISAPLIQVVSMCKAFNALNIEIYLAIEGKSSITNEDAKRIIDARFQIGDGVKVILYKGISKSKRINTNTNHFRIKSLIRQLKPDICFVRNVNFMATCLRIGSKVIYESHNGRQHLGSKLYSHYLKRKLLYYSRHDNLLLFICISQRLKEYWVKQGVLPNKLIVLHDGFSENMFESSLTKIEARKILNIYSQKRPVITYAGILSRDRGIKSIIQIASKINQADFFIIGGTEPQINHYKLEASNLGVTNVYFVGQVEHIDIPAYLFASDVLLALWTSDVPTINYCSPLKVFEYMAAGRIILAPGFSVIKEVLRDGENAILFTPDNSDSMYDRLMDILSGNVSAGIGIVARREAFKNFSWIKRVERITKILEEE